MMRLGKWFWFNRWYREDGKLCYGLYLFFNKPFRISIIYTPGRGPG
jgi:hypothetical protein